MHICHVECHPEDVHDPLWHRVNMAPMAIQSAYDWKPRVDADLEYLASLPRDLRGLRFDWWGDPRLSKDWGLYSQQLADEISRRFPGEPKPLGMVFVDQEHPSRDPDVLTGWLDPLSRISELSCNFNDAVYGSAIWGRYGGKKTGTAANFECYPLTSNPAMARAISLMQQHADGGVPIVPHLPVCCKANEWPYEHETNLQVLALRNRQLVYNAGARGVRRFVLAAYMLSGLPERDQRVVVDTISRAMLDMDRLYL